MDRWPLLRDIRIEVLSRLPTLLHLYGGLTPMNVWDMTVDDFHVLAYAADNYGKQN